MAKEYPVGTIRHWESGDVIKAHSPIKPFSDGWIPLKTSKELESIGINCDRVASQILSYKEPIDGELFLDHEINEYTDENGDKIFSADSFKQYSGFAGAERYAFRNEFSRLFMSDTMSLSEQTNMALQEANAEELSEREIYDENKIVLTKEERREIRERVRREFKENEDRFNVKDAEKLQFIVERTLEQVREGTDFKDPKKKEAYEKAIEIANSLPEEYEKIGIKRKLKNKTIEDIDRVFSDNWGIQESFKKYINKKFSEYVEKYAKRISDDSLEEQMAIFNINIDMDAKTFYTNIHEAYKKFNKEEIEEYGESFKDLIYLRFMKKYNKTVEGEWDFNSLPAIYNLENIINELPDGHFKTNSYLDIVTNKDYKGGDNGGYAWYSSMEKRINLSTNAIKSDSVWGQLDKSTEFKSVMLHEIGHSVSKKLGRNNNINYKEFVVECGWSYQQTELYHGQTATGDQKKIVRGGSNGSLELITDYSKTAPEEAFAEYYSFYNLNKKSIDKYLKTNNHKYLEQKTAYSCEFNNTSQSLSKALSHKILDNSDISYEKFNNILPKITRGDSSIEHKFVSPWKTFRSIEEEKSFENSRLRTMKNRNTQTVPPIVVVRDRDKFMVIDGSHRNEVMRMNKKLSPALTISKQLYYKLREEGLSDNAISRCIITKMKGEDVKIQKAPQKIIKGLVYRDRVVDSKTLISNAKIFKEMSKINRLPELQKAIMSLFSFSESDIYKARVGVYKDTAENRVKHRVGQRYGTKGVEEVKSVKKKKIDSTKTKKTYSFKELEEHAKKASVVALENAIKSSDSEDMRKVAHKELERRKVEEKPALEEEKNIENDETSSDNKTDFSSVEEVTKEIKRLRDIDTDDIDEIEKIADDIQGLIKKRKELLLKKEGLRQVEFEEYRKGFKSFSKDNMKEVEEYYKTDSTEPLKYIRKFKSIRDSVSYYVDEENVYRDIRDYLTGNYKGNLESELKKVSDNLTKFISENKIKENLSLNRRVSIRNKSAKEFFTNLNVGDVYEDKSFSSTSLVEQSIFGDFNIEILAKKGSRVANVGVIGSSEFEYLIDDSSRFRVLSKTKDGIIVELL